MTLNLCQANHPTHDSITVDTIAGPMHVWDWSKYRGQALYCTGQDDVSMSLDLYGTWERPDIARFNQILDEKSGPVLDFGAHIGWYAVNAMRRGCHVLTVEADPENQRLLIENCKLVRNGALSTSLGWVAELSPIEPAELPAIRILKSDVEGHENEVIDKTRTLWQQRRIDHALLEVSPVFAGYYPALIDELIGYGYRAYIVKDEEDWVITGEDVVFPQENVWLSKLP